MNNHHCSNNGVANALLSFLLLDDFGRKHIIIMSTKRPGVASAVALSTCADASLWEAVESQWRAVVTVIDSRSGGTNDVLGQLDDSVESLGRELRDGTKTFLTKNELLDVIVPWKFSVGKARPALWKLLKSNSDEAVERATLAGLTLARDIGCRQHNHKQDKNGKTKKKSHARSSVDDNLQPSPVAALEAITTPLRGVGIATASAILTLTRPDVFCYMFDEVIDCFLSKRTYTLSVYVQCQQACQRIADQLKGEWNCANVARTLWVAARVRAATTIAKGSKSSSSSPSCTTSLVDHTRTLSTESSHDDGTEGKGSERRHRSNDEPPTKRRRILR
jgi:hypothetical protein